ncbi:type 1 glutamine amidotransferase [Methanolobus chelungpuianus]|uniref:Amidotransferase n=1 Tax=Methanolobus chelungpuianus TaxID=502115 RepID=A0AAE3H907_9EURY|nr:type 1 glutamine amidotransferase [Methanolobus chelungpuianus]MCQ6962357.1 amidotransferase [Methanolobus chelungpuianus]
MRIHCLQHLEFETLGNIPGWVHDRGHVLTKSLPYVEVEFPHTDDFDLLLIMGGLMSIYQENEHPWLKKEKAFVRSSIEAGKAVLGICFGAQMLSEVLGSSVRRNNLKEIGWHSVEMVESWKEEFFLQGLSGSFTVFQWHGDTYGLPPGARRLFTSAACMEQGFVYRDNILALQFHPEVNGQCLSNLVMNCRSDLQTDGSYVQSEAEILNRPEMIESSARLMFSILGRFEDLYRSSLAGTEGGRL